MLKGQILMQLEQSVPLAAQKGKTGFRIDVPCMYTLPVGDVVGLYTWITMHDGVAGTFFGAFSTDHTKVPDTEFDGAVRYQGQISKDFG